VSAVGALHVNRMMTRSAGWLCGVILGEMTGVGASMSWRRCRVGPDFVVVGVGAELTASFAYELVGYWM